MKVHASADLDPNNVPSLLGALSLGVALVACCFGGVCCALLVVAYYTLAGRRQRYANYHTVAVVPPL